MNLFGWLGVFLTTLFVGLKLTGYISWPWWLVLLPVWGPLAIGIILVILMFVVALLGR
jgi:hypothetical protein